MVREFKEFSKIHQLSKAEMRVTQKIHGTNAQIAIILNEETGELEFLTGSRTRWIYPGDDNYGFAAFVHANKAEFVEKLGPGIHFGEWAGPGINSGEGLTQKTFVLFDFWRYPLDRPLPPQTVLVPVLYSGPMDLSKIASVMEDLKTTGSKLVPGYMRPEGVVVSVLGARYKKVFEAEETKWTQPSGSRAPKAESIDYGHLLQPIRLEKLLSKDERFVREFPESLVSVVAAYFDDLVSEGQVPSDPGQLKAIRKGASSQIFNFIRQNMSNRN